MKKSIRTFTQKEVDHLRSIGNVVGGVVFYDEPVSSEGSAFILINEGHSKRKLQSAAAALWAQRDVVEAIKVVDVETFKLEIGAGVPNLDALSYKELVEFWHNASHHPRKTAAILFPGRVRNHVWATNNLGNYAINKATAIHCREDGQINQALMYEAICEKIYNELPEWARW